MRRALADAGIAVSLFIDAEPDQVRAAADLAAQEAVKRLLRRVAQ